MSALSKKRDASVKVEVGKNYDEIFFFPVSHCRSWLCAPGYPRTAISGLHPLLPMSWKLLQYPHSLVCAGVHRQTGTARQTQWLKAGDKMEYDFGCGENLSLCLPFSKPPVLPFFIMQNSQHRFSRVKATEKSFELAQSVLCYSWNIFQSVSPLKSTSFI